MKVEDYELMIVRSGGKAFLGRSTDSPAALKDVCEVVSLMGARGGGLAKQVILTGIDYSSKPLGLMEFSSIDNHYSVADMSVDKERENLVRDYISFCEPDKKIIEPTPAEVIVTK